MRRHALVLGPSTRRRRAPPPAPPRRSGCRARWPSPRSVVASGATVKVPAAAPANTSPVPPSMVIVSPTARLRSPMAIVRSPSTTAAAPTTAGIPQPRATTAAWLASPPVEVRIPAALAMPWTSSGDVSVRTRITARPASAASAAASGDVTISPQATPGEAGRPVVRAAPASRRSLVTNGGLARIPATRRTASPRSRGKSGSSAMSTAMRSAAWGLRLPTRHWSIQSLPCSTVNSMSHRSRLWRSSRVAKSRSCRATPGSRWSRTVIGSVRWVPATTSSPWALNITSP